MTSPFTDDELRAYAAALQRAIEHHCRGLLVPDDIAQECPLHAKKLNGALCVEARQDVRRYRHLRADGCTYGPGWYCNEKLDAVLDAEMAALAEGKS